MIAIFQKAVIVCLGLAVTLAQGHKAPPPLGEGAQDFSPPAFQFHPADDYVYEAGEPVPALGNGTATMLYVAAPPIGSLQWRRGYVALSRVFGPVHGGPAKRATLGILEHAHGIRLVLGDQRVDFWFDDAHVGSSYSVTDGRWLAKAVVLELDTSPDPDPDLLTKKFRVIKHVWIRFVVVQQDHEVARKRK